MLNIFPADVGIGTGCPAIIANSERKMNMNMFLFRVDATGKRVRFSKSHQRMGECTYTWITGLSVQVGVVHGLPAEAGGKDSVQIDIQASRRPVLD